VNAKELPETRAVDYLVLDLMIAQTIITLKKYDFEHQDNIYGLADRCALDLLGQKRVFKNRAKHLEVHLLGKSLKGIAHSGESLDCQLFLKQVFTHWPAVYCRFLPWSRLFIPQRYDFFLNYASNLLIINNLIYRTPLKQITPPKRSLLLSRKIHYLLSYAHGLDNIIINHPQRYKIFGNNPKILPKKLLVRLGIISTRKQESV